MARKKPGIQGPGRERLSKNWEELQSGDSKIGERYGHLIGRPSEKSQRLEEEIARINETILSDMEEQDVQTLPDLWPDRSNYYKGPSKSTRVSKHMFSLNAPTNPNVPPTQGTMFVKFTNMRPNGQVRRENIYAYYNVPFDVYKSFTMSSSKGRFINRLDKVYTYARLDDESVFDIGA